jgi:hypothetical protein
MTRVHFYKNVCLLFGSIHNLVKANPSLGETIQIYARSHDWADKRGNIYGLRALDL